MEFIDKNVLTIADILKVGQDINHGFMEILQNLMCFVYFI